MRRFRIAPALLLLALAAPAAAQWDTQSPVPTHLDVRGIGAPTPQHAFIATDDNSFDDGGALFETTDGGSNWVQRDVPADLGNPLNGLFFLDSQRGWAYGNANSRTTDGGTTWTELPFLGSTYFMEFENANFGLATGNFDKFVSRDGGLSWNPSPNDIFAFEFADVQIGLGVAETGIYRTTNGGTSFASVRAGAAVDVTFLSASVAIGIVNGSFVRSTNAGVTWATGSSTQGRSHLVAVSSNVVLAWGRTGFPNYDDRVLRSSDGGQTWTDLGEVLNASDNASGFAFAVPSPTTVVASNGDGDLLHSTNAGATWTQTFTSLGSQPGYLSSAVPVFADASTGYFGYGAGFVIKTTDGGASWSQISSGTGQSLNDVARFPNGNLIAVGEGGALLRKSGTGPWIIEPAFTAFHLTAVQVIGAQDVVVVDQPGRVFRSSDAGATWTGAAATPADFEAADLHFTTLLDGWVAGSGFSSGALFHTTNGGASWDAADGPAGGYVAVDFEGASGWTVNVGAIFYRSTNSGATWTQMPLPGALQSNSDMEFFNESIGYVVGRFGTAARTSDGGVTWQELPTPDTNAMLTDIHLLAANELWVSTASGVAYHSATGGLSWSVLDTETTGFGNFSAITAVPGGDAWTVGFQGYIEHFTGPPPGPVNQPPASSFDFVATGLSIVLTDTSTDPDGTIVSWAWDFGDGATSTEQNPSHTFAVENTYIVTLTVTDDDGATDIGGQAIVVQPGPGGTFGEFTEVTPLDPLFVTPQDEDFWVSTTAPADYDNDGDLDVAVLGYYVVYNESVEFRLVLFRNDGPASAVEWEFAYIDVPLGDLSVGASDLAWADADGDGDQDLVVASDGATILYRNDGGTLVATDTVLPGYSEDNDQANFDLRSVTWADFDNDGDQDLLLPSIFDFETFSARTALMRNEGPNGSGGWNFVETDSTFAATGHAQSSWADFDGDQDLDLLLVDVAPLTEEGFIRRYRNDGAGIFVGQDILGSLTVEHGEAQWGDYDADGDLDVLIAGNIKELDGTYDTVLRVYRNDAETYVPFEVISCVPCEGWFDITAATWADYDSDGDVDILLTGTYNSGSEIEGRATIYDNEGGVFTDSGNQLPAPRASGSRGGTFTWLDLDGEGDLDYFIAGEYFVPGGNGLIEAQMHAYRNDVEGQNLAPSAPSGLKANVNSVARTAILSWTAANDDFTPVAALTYDLELNRNGVPVANPRRLPQPGSVGAETHWNLTGLTDGLYRWALRAVDSAYNGGPAVQGSFLLGPPVGVETASVLPREFEFAGTSSNPFRGATTFRFALPEAANVNLSVFDVNGRLVDRLVEEVRAPGFYDIRWEARGVASGAYFIRFSTEKFTKTQRVLLLK